MRENIPKKYETVNKYDNLSNKLLWQLVHNKYGKLYNDVKKLKNAN